MLKALLSVSNTETKDIYMKRFGVNFVLQPITPGKMTKLTERSTRMTKNGKQFDEELFNYLTIVEACVEPSWSDPEIIEALEATDAVDAIKKRLLFGEIATLLQEIASINGFDKSDEEMVEEIKN